MDFSRFFLWMAQTKNSHAIVIAHVIKQVEPFSTSSLAALSRIEVWFDCIRKEPLPKARSRQGGSDCSTENRARNHDRKSTIKSEIRASAAPKGRASVNCSRPGLRNPLVLPIFQLETRRPGFGLLAAMLFLPYPVVCWRLFVTPEAKEGPG